MNRFPLGITLAAAVGLAILLGLGAWQLKRLAWKEALLGKIAALEHAAPKPLEAVLASAARGADVGFVRVSAVCGNAPPRAAPIYRYALREGRVGWRLLGYCPLAGGPWSGIVLDRGLVNRFAGQMAPAAAAFGPARSVIGVLRAPGRHSFLDVPPQRLADGATSLQALDPAALSLIAGPGERPAPWYLAVENDAPPPTGVTPAPLPQDIPNNHFVYALTWFGLAAVLTWTWAAYVWRRMRAP